ncbi:MAG: TspO/MBR family protein [Rickettsiales bacterium]
MEINNKKYISLFIWIILIILSGSIIGSFTKPSIDGWYTTINRSDLTPPNYIFPIVWTILYGMLGAAGWCIWNANNFKQIKLLKTLYIIQLILNWSWSPIFFNYHLTGTAFVIINLMETVVSMIIYLTYAELKLVALLMLPYLSWILFAGYLNFYIWWNN